MSEHMLSKVFILESKGKDAKTEKRHTERRRRLLDKLKTGTFYQF